MDRFPARSRVLTAAAGVAAALLAAACGSGSPTSAATHSAPPAAASSAPAPVSHGTSQAPVSSGAASGGFSQIQGPQGEPVLDAKCQMEPSQQNLPTFQLSLSSPTGAGQGVQSVSVTFSNGVQYVASFAPITVPSSGVATSTTTAAAYPPNDSMPSGCKVTAYNQP